MGKKISKSGNKNIMKMGKKYHPNGKKNIMKWEKNIIELEEMGTKYHAPGGYFPISTRRDLFFPIP